MNDRTDLEYFSINLFFEMKYVNKRQVSYLRGNNQTKKFVVWCDGMFSLVVLQRVKRLEHQHHVFYEWISKKRQEKIFTFIYFVLYSLSLSSSWEFTIICIHNIAYYLKMMHDTCRVNIFFRCINKDKYIFAWCRKRSFWICLTMAFDGDGFFFLCFRSRTRWWTHQWR